MLPKLLQRIVPGASLGALSGANELSNIIQFSLQTRTAARERDDIQKHDQPCRKKAVEHESEITSVHGNPTSKRSPADEESQFRAPWPPGVSEQELAQWQS